MHAPRLLILFEEENMCRNSPVKIGLNLGFLEACTGERRGKVAMVINGFVHGVRVCEKTISSLKAFSNIMSMMLVQVARIVRLGGKRENTV